MRQLGFNFAAGLVACLLSGEVLRATPFSAVDQTTTCIQGASQQFCTGSHDLLGANGAALPATLADIAAVAAVIGESSAPVTDRSHELAVDRFNEPGYAPVIAGPQLMSSIQLSLDPLLDLGGPLTVAGVAGLVDTRRHARALDKIQVELTLGTALAGVEARNLDGRIFRKADYVSFALINQAHVARPVAVIEETPGDEEGF